MNVRNIPKIFQIRQIEYRMHSFMQESYRLFLSSLRNIHFKFKLNIPGKSLNDGPTFFNACTPLMYKLHKLKK